MRVRPVSWLAKACVGRHELAARWRGTEVPWRGGRVAEGARLESVFTGNRNVGSNPTPSATFLLHRLKNFRKTNGAPLPGPRHFCFGGCLG